MPSIAIERGARRRQQLVRLPHKAQTMTINNAVAPITPPDNNSQPTSNNNKPPMTSGNEGANKANSNGNTETKLVATSSSQPPCDPTPGQQNTSNKTSAGNNVTIQIDDDGDKSKEAGGSSSNLGTSLVTGDQEMKDKANKANVAAEKVLSVSANLAKLLPSGAVLVFQTLSASFTNQGSCNTANRWLSGLLVAFLTATCIFLTFTDSIVYNKKVYYGVALPRRLNIFAVTKAEEKELFRKLSRELKERRLRALDWVHAVFTAIVFISIAMGDVGLQKCFVPDLDTPHMQNVKELLRNAPLGLALLSSFVFMIFPTTRHGVGFDNSDQEVTDHSTDEARKKAAAQQPSQKENNNNQTA